MEAITINPESLKVPFESHSTNLPDHVIKSIDKSLDQFNAGKSISFESFKEKHFRKR